MSIKSAAKKAFPGAYYYLHRTLNPPKDGWDYYADAIDARVLEPEPCILLLKDRIPAHVDTFFNIGCMPGRDFVPFQDGPMKLRGIDVRPFSRVNWLCKTDNLSYYEMTGQLYTKLLAGSNEDLSHALVYLNGTLMQLKPQEQRDLHAECVKHGCKNFIYRDAPKDHAEFGVDRAARCFYLDESEFQETQIEGDSFKVWYRFA